jgi:hypothetical protein
MSSSELELGAGFTGSGGKVKITKARLEELGLPGECEGGEIITNRIVDQRRWVTIFESIVRLPEQMGTERACRIYYERGSTEMQDSEPFARYSDPFEVEEVEQITVALEVWAPLNWDGVSRSKLTLSMDGRGL